MKPFLQLWPYTLGILVSTVVACNGTSSGKVRLREDSFRNIRSFSLVLKNMPDESGSAENPRLAKLEFWRDEVAKSPSMLTLTLKVDEADPELSKEIFMKIDGTAVRLTIDDFQVRTASQQYLRSVNEFGSVGFNTTVSATLLSRLYRIRIRFDANQETALSRCSAFAIRAYLGNEALNLSFPKSDAAAIQRFFAGTADEITKN